MRQGVTVGRELTPNEEERLREEANPPPTEPQEFRDRPERQVVGLDDLGVSVSSTLDIQDTGLCGFDLRCTFRVDREHHAEAFARAAAAEDAVRCVLRGELEPEPCPEELPEFILREMGVESAADG